MKLTPVAPTGYRANDRTSRSRQTFDLSSLYPSHLRDLRLENPHSDPAPSLSSRASFQRDKLDLLLPLISSRRPVQLAPYVGLSGKEENHSKSIGCNRSIESINARAEERSRAQILVNETKKREDAEQTDTIQKSIHYKYERQERKAAMKENEKRRKFWTKIVAIVTSQIYTIRYLPLKFDEKKNKKIRAAAATKIQEMFLRVRSNKLNRMSVVLAKDFWRLVSLLSAMVRTSNLSFWPLYHLCPLILFRLVVSDESFCTLNVTYVRTYIGSSLASETGPGPSEGLLGVLLKMLHTGG